MKQGAAVAGLLVKLVLFLTIRMLSIGRCAYPPELNSRSNRNPTSYTSFATFSTLSENEVVFCCFLQTGLF